MFCFRLSRQRYMIQNCTKEYKKGSQPTFKVFIFLTVLPFSKFGPSVPSSSTYFFKLSNTVRVLYYRICNYCHENVKFVSAVYLHPWTPFLFTILSLTKILFSHCMYGICSVWLHFVALVFDSKLSGICSIVKDLPRSRTASIAPASFCFWALPSRPVEVSPRVRIFSVLWILSSRRARYIASLP